VKLWQAPFFALGMFVALFAALYFLRNHPGGERAGVLNKVAWQRMARPGALSQAHAFLEHDCAACHTSVKGVEAANCIVCHASNAMLLQRQPTVFHANVSSCRECHHEHRGVHETPTLMDHAALSRIGLRKLNDNPDPETEDRLASAHFVRWINEQGHDVTSGPGANGLTPEERILDCFACHETKDRHFGLFGQDCAQCHGSVAWAIPEFRHPPPTSLDCAQCHQAPPSHYMMHFKMISMTTAGVEKAEVNECFLCHQTTSWNDIKGVGFYKHH
jgi:hypothetical protein